jgi:hypothetical protein
LGSDEIISMIATISPLRIDPRPLRLGGNPRFR